MTAKDKARELVNHIYSKIQSKESSLIDDDRDWDSAKAGAIIAVDEILAVKNFPNTLHPKLVEFENAYWKYVKLEIEKL
jgi:hypothetical protein